MRGYGLTVMRGMRPERFDVEVIDVVHNFRPHADLVLIRPSHPVLEHAGTVGGMSGSPIYINDRLIGAYAYGWEFGRDPVAGVTPIAQMLAELRRPRRTPPGLMPGSSAPLPIVSEAAERASLDTLSRRNTAARAPVETAYGSLVPVSTPMSFSGLSRTAFAHLAEALAPLGVTALQAAGGGGPATAPSDAPTRYEAGGALTVRMIQGDISGNAGGTVTWAEGNNVLAFGHPLASGGETALPTAIARVMWILASERRSFKISEPVRNLGALVQDRGPAIILDTQSTAPTFPVRVRVIGVEGTPHDDWNVTVAAWRPLAARLTGSVIETAIEETASDMGDVAWSVRSRVRLRGRQPVEVTELGSGAEGPRAIRGVAANEVIARALDNAFAPVAVEGVDVEVRLRWAREFAFVRSVSLARAEVDPGDEAELRVSLGRYGQPPEMRVIRVPIGRELAGREVELEVASGSDTVPDLAEPESLDDVLRNLQTRYPDDALVVSMKLPDQGVTLRGRVVPNLPSSALDLLRPGASTDGGEALQNMRRVVVPIGRVVLGRDRVRLRVREVRR